MMIRNASLFHPSQKIALSSSATPTACSFGSEVQAKFPTETFLKQIGGRKKNPSHLFECKFPVSGLKLLEKVRHRSLAFC